MMKAKTEAQARNDRDSYMFVNGAWPLWTVRITRASVWRSSPAKASHSPVTARLSFFEKR